MYYDPERFPKSLRIGSIVLVLLLLIGGSVYYGLKFIKKPKAETPNRQKEISIPKNAENVFVNDVSGVQEAAENSTEILSSASQSENYMIREITFGGYEVDMSGEVKNTPLEILNAKGETAVSRDGKEVKLVFSWKTNKLAVSRFTYAKNDGPAKNTLSEQGPGLSHALIVKLEPSSRYTYFVTAKDRWGNAATSEKFSIFTSTKNDNVIDLISQQFRQIFSWTGMK